MATIYIAPTAQGTGDGTSEANAYAYSSLDTAESDAGNGGTILFLDGTYSISNTTWDPLVTNFTYKSLNKHGAIITTTQSRTLRLGANDGSKTVNFQDFKITGALALMSQSNAIISGMMQIDSISATNQYGSFYKLGGHFTITDSVIVKDFSGNNLFNNDSSCTFTRCSIFLKCSSVGANGITGNGPILKNTIIMSDNASAINDNVVNTSTCTNCCVFQMHSNDASGGTNNVFTDPQFVDSANGDLRLRPSSPCINAGTTS
jgi:hypothetical protein